MFAGEITESVCIVTSWRVSEIAEHLAHLFQDKPFSYMAPIQGKSRSGRVLSPCPYMDAVALPRPLSPKQAAEELLRLAISEARYDPMVQPGNKHKGWEIRVARNDQGLILVAWATWVDP